MKPEDRAVEMLAALGFEGARQVNRVRTLAKILADHPDAVVEECSDENTGQRYGLANCRRGRCKKIGHTTWQYQLWAVWGGAQK